MSWKDVERVLASLPGVEAGTSYGTPAFRVGGKLIARQREDDGAAVVRVDPAERPALLAEGCGSFYVTPHYEDTVWVLVDLATVDALELAEVLTDAWRLAAPRRLVARHDERHGT